MKRLRLVPLGFAVAIAVAFGVLHALGFRQDAALLSGSAVPSVACGVAYVLLYFAAVVIVPIIVIATLIAGLGTIVARDRRRAR